tara:strand:- start:1572 stop:2525 length:954 start_codon:yes stop_codon:yes gene_type:complete
MVGTGGELADNEQTQVSNFINRRFQQAFDESPVWPRYFVPSEKRKLSAFALAGSVPSSYRVPYGKFGIYQGSDFFAPIDTTGNTGIFMYKPSSTKKWKVAFGTYTKSFFQGSAVSSITITENDEPFTQSDTKDYASPLDVPRWISGGSAPVSGVLELNAMQVVPYSETQDFESANGAPNRAQRKNIGDFNRIHRKEAFLNNSTLEYDFYVDTEGANVLNVQSGTDFVFVSYKEQFTPFTVTSNYYTSVVEVPGEFFNYIAHAVYADFLRVQNRQEEALAEEQVAQTYLNLELEKIDIRSNNNTINKRFSTYVNRQSR